MLGSQFRLCSAGRVGGEGSGGLRAGWGRALPSRRWDACFWSFFVSFGFLRGFSSGEVLGVGKGGGVGGV